jgi:hypothetical protein
MYKKLMTAYLINRNWAPGINPYDDSKEQAKVLWEAENGGCFFPNSWELMASDQQGDPQQRIRVEVWGQWTMTT